MSITKYFSQAAVSSRSMPLSCSVPRPRHVPSKQCLTRCSLLLACSSNNLGHTRARWTMFESVLKSWGCSEKCVVRLQHSAWKKRDRHCQRIDVVMLLSLRVRDAASSFFLRPSGVERFTCQTPIEMCRVASWCGARQREGTCSADGYRFRRKQLRFKNREMRGRGAPSAADSCSRTVTRWTLRPVVFVCNRGLLFFNELSDTRPVCDRLPRVL